MSRARLAAAMFVLAAPAAGAAVAPASGPTLARLTYVEQKVEQGGAESASPWRPAREGSALRIGEQIRTDAGAGLHLDFPWMAASVSASSALRFPDGPFLQGVLERGRVALRADRRDILKVVAGEAEVRGRGRVVVWRRESDTVVSAHSGGFFVDAGGAVVSLTAGTGTIVRAGQPPTPAASLPAPPNGLVPGDDPIYAAPRAPVRLRWSGRAESYHVEVLAVGSETVLIERDVQGTSAEVAIPWSGAFRWRVSSRDARGLEGPPSGDGFFCIDE